MPGEKFDQSVFEKTYHYYLNKIFSNITNLSTDRLGVSLRDNEIEVTLLNEKYCISQNGVVDPSGNYAVKREIKLGRQNPDYFEVLDGLKPGDKVVTSSYDTYGDIDKLVLK